MDLQNLVKAIKNGSPKNNDVVMLCKSNPQSSVTLSHNGLMHNIFIARQSIVYYVIEGGNTELFIKYDATSGELVATSYESRDEYFVELKRISPKKQGFAQIFITNWK